MRKYFERAKDADTAYTIGSWSFWFIDKFLLPGIGAAVVIWAASQADWFWVAYGLFGVLGAGIVAALAISLVLFLSGIGMRAWRGGARKPTSETSTETAHSAEPVSASQTVAEAGLR